MARRVGIEDLGKSRKKAGVAGVERSRMSAVLVELSDLGSAADNNVTR